MAVVINLSDPGAVPGASTDAASLARYPFMRQGRSLRKGGLGSFIGGGEIGSTRA